MLNNAALDDVFRALGDPTRRAMVEQLSRRPSSVSELAKPFGITLAAVMQHLAVLEHSGLVHTAKVGRVRTCQIEPKGLSLVERWVDARRSTWQERFDRLGEVLAEESAPKVTSPRATRSKPRRRS